ncbi:MAG TPA: CehA/McbA family metallohydrolase, partial [Vicinamibacterales bacterium]|nr:CehA/McbA family metallohydrolase [Vicinamibacterales bacterium]
HALVVVAAAGLGAMLWGNAAPAAQPAPDRSAWRWYKGNTHAHTLESDGDSTPEEVTRWYHERGYQFLVLSDHNVLTAIDALSRQFAAPESFLLVPGEEVTDTFAQAPLHLNGLNVSRLVAPQHGDSVAATLQRNVDAIRTSGGVPHINHPNFGWAIAPADLAALERCRLLEIYNGHPLVNNLGGGDRPGMEEVWDRLLTAGRRVYGIAVDDAHYFKRPWDPMAPKPGRGWVVVHAPRLEATALLTSLENGDFYASTGVELESYAAAATAIEVRVRVAGTTRYRLELVSGGAVVQTVEGSSARFELRGRSGYARVAVRDSNGAQAWTQPVFLP